MYDWWQVQLTICASPKDLTNYTDHSINSLKSVSENVPYACLYMGGYVTLPVQLFYMLHSLYFTYPFWRILCITCWRMSVSHEESAGIQIFSIYIWYGRLVYCPWWCFHIIGSIDIDIGLLCKKYTGSFSTSDFGFIISAVLLQGYFFWSGQCLHSVFLTLDWGWERNFGIFRGRGNRKFSEAGEEFLWEGSNFSGSGRRELKIETQK